MCIYGGDTGHTHTNTRAGRPEVAVNLFSAFFPSWTVLPQGPPRSSGQLCSARGPSEVNRPSFGQGWTRVLLFGMFFLLGFLLEETPCEHGENMQTPHRKAREIAHLSTVHSGEDLPSRANSAPCGN